MPEMKPLLAAADRIIWLDAGAKRSTSRILRRHLRHTLQGRRRYSHRSTLRLAYHALTSDRRSGARLPASGHELPWRQEIMAELEPYRAKVTRVSSLAATRRIHY